MVKKNFQTPPRVVDDRLIKILMIEDDPLDAKALIRDLNSVQRSRYEVMPVETEAEAIAALRAGKFDLCLLVVNLMSPGDFGIVSRMRELAPGLPFLLMTDTEDRSLGIRAVQAGVEDYLEKGKLPPESLERCFRYCVERNELYHAMNETEMKVMASTKMAELGEMAARIVHEISNPLSVIGGYGALLQELAESEELDETRVLEISSKIQDMVRRVAKISKNLKTFARDGSQDPVSPESIKDIIDQTLEFCHTRIRESDVKLEVDPIPEEVRISCRPVQISQVLLNLLNNAIHACQSKHDRKIKIEYSDWGETIEIAVVDSGPGIESNVQRRIFDPFFTTKERGKGTGLGLSVSKDIIMAHNGELFLDKKSTQTRFVIRLMKESLEKKESA